MRYLPLFSFLAPVVSDLLARIRGIHGLRSGGRATRM